MLDQEDFLVSLDIVLLESKSYVALELHVKKDLAPRGRERLRKGAMKKFILSHPTLFSQAKVLYKP